MICAFAAKQHEIEIWFAAGGMNPGEDPCFQQYYRIVSTAAASRP